jgi:hypothetical protein
MESKDKPLTYNSMRSYGQSNNTWMRIALDWAAQQSVSNKDFAHLDLGKVGAGGQSCGGMEAAVISKDTRVKTIAIFNSGAFSPDSMPKIPGGLPKLPGGMALPMDVPNGSTFKVPVFYFLGGETDIATPNVSYTCLSSDFRM